MRTHCLVVLIFLLPSAIFGRQKGSSKLKVYLECIYSDLCNLDFIRQQIPVVDYVRDAYTADLHIQVTGRETGSSGSEHTVLLHGRQALSYFRDTIIFYTQNISTENERRLLLTNFLKARLVPLLLKNGSIQSVQVTFNETDTNKTAITDKWQNWVFNIGGQVSLNGDKNYNEHAYGANVRINKVTEKYKTGIEFYHNTARNIYRYEDNGSDVELKTSNDFTYIRHDYVKSLSPKWSAGTEVEYEKSTYDNYKSAVNLYAGFEYNIYPYTLSSSKFLVLRYRLNADYRDYFEPTLYDKTSELLFAQDIAVFAAYTQQWGSINSSLTWYNYLHDFSKNMLSLNLYLQIRVAKGLSLTFHGNSSIINDQLNIAREGASTQEVLLRLKALSTSYNYYTGFGINYQFGSTFNNIVNTRFTNGRMF
jgi:hypothetical protein